MSNLQAISWNIFSSRIIILSSMVMREAFYITLYVVRDTTCVCPQDRKIGELAEMDDYGKEVPGVAWKN